MKAKKLALVVLILAIVGVGLWWLMQPTVATPEKTAQVLTPTKADAPKQVAPPVQVELPKTSAVPANADATSPTVDASADPQADLKTAIPNIVNLLRLGDIYTLKKTYTPPNKLSPEQFQQMLNNVVQGMGRMEENPKLRETMHAAYAETATHYESFENEAPTYNASGDEASYTYAIQPLFDGDESQRTTTFIKINGKWYIKGMDGGNW